MVPAGYFAMLHWLAHARGALISSDAARLAATLVAVEVGAGVVHVAITVTLGGEHRQGFGGPGAWEFGGDAAVGSVEQPHRRRSGRAGEHVGEESPARPCGC